MHISCHVSGAIKLLLYFNQVHPGQITFFEFKYNLYDKSILATSDGDLKEIYLWDIYNRESCQNIDPINPDTPDAILLAPKNYEIENMRWNNNSYLLLASMKDENNENNNILSFYDISTPKLRICKPESKQLNNTSKLLKQKKVNISKNYPSKSVKLPINISYFTTDDGNDNIIYATSSSTKFSFDIRNPKTYSTLNYSEDINSKDSNGDIMVEYNQNNYLLFADRFTKNITISDIRKVI